jgi:transcriptional antiterminator RfaH
MPFHKGEVVQVTAGALADQVGFFDCATDEDRVVLLLDLLGRQVKVTLPLETVAPLA